MYSLACVYALALAVASVLAVPSGVHGAARHSARHARRRAEASSSQLSKRDFTDARWTFYAPGLGACGGTNGPNDFIVALNQAQWDGGSHCNEQITMSYGGKTTTATIVDLCPGCPYGGLDLAPGLFSFFADQSLGVIDGTWDFGSGGGSGGGNPPAPTTTSAAPPPPPPPPTTTSTSTTTSQDPAPTINSIAQQLTQTPSSSSSSTSSSVATSTSTTTSSSGTSTAVPANPLYVVESVPSNSGNLANMFLSVVQMGLLMERA